MQKKQNEQAKIVCEFEFDIESVAEMEQMIHEYYQCTLCGGELMYTHVSNFLLRRVEEQSECSSCGVKHAKKQHTLN